MTKDDFELWQAHPVTEHVFKAMERLEERNKRRWMDISWNGGMADLGSLRELKAMATVYKDLRELTFEELEEAINDQT